MRKDIIIYILLLILILGYTIFYFTTRPRETINHTPILEMPKIYNYYFSLENESKIFYRVDNETELKEIK